MAQPERKGFYLRISKIGASIDYWDGNQWHRRSARGVVCANQSLPWRRIGEPHTCLPGAVYPRPEGEVVCRHCGWFPNAENLAAPRMARGGGTPVQSAGSSRESLDAR